MVVLSMVLICASIVNVSATVGVTVGDKYNYDVELFSNNGTDEYTVTGDLEIEVTLIEGNIITYKASDTNTKAKGSYPDNLNLTDSSDLMNLTIYNDDISTNASMMAGAHFIDKDFTPKTFSYNESATILLVTIETSIESEYDDDGVLKSSEYTLVMKMGELVSTEMRTKMNRSGSAIPGYSVLIIGVISLLTIPMIVRKIRR